MRAAGACSSLETIAVALLAGALSVAPVPAAAQGAGSLLRIAPTQGKAKPPAPSTTNAAPAAQATKPARGKPKAPAKAAKAPAPTNATTPAPAQKPSPVIAPPAPPAKLEPLPPIDTSTPPPMLPRASRARMRECADEWNQMKRRATAGLPLWRDFATGCLTRPTRGAEEKNRQEKAGNVKARDAKAGDATTTGSGAVDAKPPEKTAP